MGQRVEICGESLWSRSFHNKDRRTACLARGCFAGFAAEIQARHQTMATYPASSITAPRIQEKLASSSDRCPPPSQNAATAAATLGQPPPDGGWQAWAQVVSGHFVVAVTWGYSASFGVFQSHYEATLPQSASEISWIGGFQIFCLLFVSTASGRATDAGLARAVMIAGAVLLVLGTFMTSLATEYWQIFLAQGLCVGVGQGLMWLPSVTIISTYFVRRRVFAVTAAATGTSTGGIIFPAMVQHLIPKIGMFFVSFFIAQG